LTQGDWQLKTYTLEPKTLPIEQVNKTPWCVKYEHSFKGIRDRDYPEFPPKDVLRIVCVGDSFVFGEGVPVEKTLVRQLEGLAGKSVEIINGGQMGFDTLQELDILTTIAREGHCSRGIIVFIPNDIAAAPKLAGRQKYINDLVQIRDVYLQKYNQQNWHSGHLKSFQFINSPIAMNKIKQETIQWYLDLYDPRHNQNNLQIFKEAIQFIPQIPDCQNVLILYPLLEGFETGYPLQAIHDQVKSIAEHAGIPVLDLMDAFRGQKTADLWVHPTDHHPNGTAHQIAASAIYEWLKKDVPGFLE
jgi:lysophospholipase L1-like esterase